MSSGAGEIIEGKRAKKSVERLDMEAPKKAVKLSIGEGKLGDIPRIGFQLNKLKPDVLVPLHSLLFDRRGKVCGSSLKNIRLFNGFPFDADSEQFTKKRDKLQKNTKAKLHLMCGVLDLEKKGSNAELVEKIMAFLLSPKSSGKVRTHKKRSKKNLSGDDSKSKKKSSKKRGSSSSNQKPSSTSSPKKSKAIVMDSSSDDDEEEEEEKAQSEESEAGSGEESGAGSGGAPQSEEEPSDGGEEEEEEEEEVRRPSNSKTTVCYRLLNVTRRPERRFLDVVKGTWSWCQSRRCRRRGSDDSEDEQVSCVPADDSSDEDEPLSKMETVQKLLKEADLEELTMKKICQKVKPHIWMLQIYYESYE
uniref:DEK n=1 Tax=Neogobius melanostomus TaxID=47308 RepID=A0A8C6U309_9GOBI